MKRVLLIAMAALGLVRIDTVTGPAWNLWGNSENIKHEKNRHVYVNHNTAGELWRVGTKDPRTGKWLSDPEVVPEKQKVVISLRTNLFRKRETIALAYPAMLAATVQKRRMVLINVEQTADYDQQYRVWPHLGILSVGTAADREGWEVVLWDELVQGHVTLENIVEPGDIVGLSLIVTGIERGVELAREAKRLGASCVIAGNDSAIFRANQLLALPDKPIDAVFTSNSLTAVRQFLRAIGTTSVEDLKVAGIQTVTASYQYSNEKEALISQRCRKMAGGEFDDLDVFITPKFELYHQSYWQEVWGNYRSCFGHKHRNPDSVKNTLALLSQGCTRAGGAEVCSYCSIYGASDIRIPSKEQVVELVRAYQQFGIDMLFNVTDSSYEMKPLAEMLIGEGISFNGLLLYGRAQGMAQKPELLDVWQKVAKDRLLINIGMDSADEAILRVGIGKSGSGHGSRVEENRQAVRYIKKSGAHLHYSLIFGSPGESRETCEKNMEFLEWTVDTLGNQLDVCETDVYWLNFGSPVSKIFRDYEYASMLANKAGNSITCEEWARNFQKYSENLVVPWEVERLWYRYFTKIEIEEALEYNQRVALRMAEHTGSIRGRAFKPSLG